MHGLQSPGRETSELEEAKRFGYIPSRGRKAEEASSGKSQETASERLEEEAKRAFHGSRGKKLAMVPMYPLGWDYQWRRAVAQPSRNMFSGVDVMSDQGPVPVPMDAEVLSVRPAFRGWKARADLLADDSEGAEDYFGDGVRHLNSQPVYPRMM